MQPASPTQAPVAAPSPAAPAPPSPPPQPPAPDTSRVKALADRLAASFPSVKVDYIRERRLKVTLPPAEMKAAALFVRDQLGFGHLNVVGGTDYPAQGEFEVIYFAGSPVASGQEDLVVQLAERVKKDSPTAPSLVEVWTAAEYHERETFEMLGITFDGHPDLRRILLPEDWSDIPPLRKDYVSPGR